MEDRPRRERPQMFAEMGLIMLSGIILAVPILAFLFRPGEVVKAYHWYWRLKLGMTRHYSSSGSYRFCYCSRGTPGGDTPSVLMLHGFSASKDMWLPIIQYLPKSLHVVCLDMPGHEGTSRTGPEDYSIHSQVRRIHQFVQSIGLDKRPFHMFGGSMGGNVAGVYAAHYPTHLTSLTLMCPAGLIYPTETKFISRLRELENSEWVEPIPLIPSTFQEFKELLSCCSYTPFNFPQQILQGVLDNRIPNNCFYKEVFMEITREKSRHSLQENLHLIRAPVQVIWGKEDQMLHVSGAAVLQAALPNCQVELLDKCGHSLNFEQPRTVAKLLLNFLCRQEVNSRKKQEKLSTTA